MAKPSVAMVGATFEFVAFDRETTGVFPVVELGAVRLRLDGRERDTCQQLVNSDRLIPPQVTEIHGVTN